MGVGGTYLIAGGITSLGEWHCREFETLIYSNHLTFSRLHRDLNLKINRFDSHCSLSKTIVFNQPCHLLFFLRGTRVL